MNVKTLQTSEHESVHFYSDDDVGLSAVIAIHTTFSGMSIGGCRIKNFSSQESAAAEVLRLSEHMTYKSLLCDLKVGGGKSVILVRPGFKKTPALLKSFASAVNSLGGRYIVSVDMGSDVEDMLSIRKNTPHVIGYNGGGAGDPGVYTAEGVLVGMKSAALRKWSSYTLKGKKVCVIGLGNAGRPLARCLINEGAKLIVSDIDPKKIEEFKGYPGVTLVDPKKAHQIECDILSPCAGGDLFNSETVKELNCQIIAGAANNQLSSEEAGEEIFKRGIWYIPDFAVNAGGLIGVVMNGLRQKNLEETRKKIASIGDLTDIIIQESQRQNQAPSYVAMEMARRKYKKIYSKTKVEKTVDGL